MLYDVNKIIEDVRTAMDENTSSGALTSIGDIDTLGLDNIIEQKIPHSVRYIIENAPVRLLDQGLDFSKSTLKWESGSAGYGMAALLLPEDFLRLVIFKMSDWRRPVNEPIYDTHHKYWLQKSKFNGIRGGVEKPVCAITTSNEGKVMECYSSRSGAKVSISVARYIKMPEISNDSIDICKDLYTPVVYHIAGMVAMTLKDSNSENLFNSAKSYLV